MTSDDSREQAGFTLKDAPSSDGPLDPSGLPRIDFSTFVLSLATSALYHLGVASDPGGGPPPSEPNLPLARQTIDTLEMLEEKTRGNLDDNEDRLLKSVLYELHMSYVKAEG